MFIALLKRVSSTPPPPFLPMLHVSCGGGGQIGFNVFSFSPSRPPLANEIPLPDHPAAKAKSSLHGPKTLKWKPAMIAITEKIFPPRDKMCISLNTGQQSVEFTGRICVFRKLPPAEPFENLHRELRRRMAKSSPDGPKAPQSKRSMIEITEKIYTQRDKKWNYLNAAHQDVEFTDKICVFRN